MELIVTGSPGNSQCIGLEVGSLVGDGVAVERGFEVGMSLLDDVDTVVSEAAQPIRIMEKTNPSNGRITRLI